MIVTKLIEMLINLLSVLFSWVSFPAMPDAVTNALDMLLQAMASAMGFIWLIVPKELVMVVLPVILVVENFDKLYSVIMWILKKIPFLGMQ